MVAKKNLTTHSTTRSFLFSFVPDTYLIVWGGVDALDCVNSIDSTQFNQKKLVIYLNYL